MGERNPQGEMHVKLKPKNKRSPALCGLSYYPCTAVSSEAQYAAILDWAEKNPDPRDSFPLCPDCKAIMEAYDGETQEEVSPTL